MNLVKTKYDYLEKILKDYESVVVAFSGGVDSTFLLKVAHDTLGENVIAVTAESCSFPKRELNEAIDFCKKENIKHIICHSEELDIEGFRSNPKNRCYLCKRELFEKLIIIAHENNINTIVEGSNINDNGDFRPGLIAIQELGIASPLRQSNLSKTEIRELSKMLGLSTWNKQSFACLSSRFAYGEEINEEKLSMVDQAEQILLDSSFHQVRVRIHDKIARIEILPEEFPKILEENMRKEIYAQFKSIGFSYVSLDLLGYRTGSMNETLSNPSINDI